MVIFSSKGYKLQCCKNGHTLNHVCKTEAAFILLIYLFIFLKHSTLQPALIFNTESKGHKLKYWQCLHCKDYKSNLQLRQIWSFKPRRHHEKYEWKSIGLRIYSGMFKERQFQGWVKKKQKQKQLKSFGESVGTLDQILYFFLRILRIEIFGQ